MNSQYCKTCNQNVNLDSLTGVHSNQCPKCGNPIMPATFGNLKNGTVFVPDQCAGLWVKYAGNMAVCVDYEDACYQVGETQGFNALETVFPY